MESKTLTREEFASLLIVRSTCAVLEPPAVYTADLSGRLRMTTSGRARIIAGRELSQSGNRD